MPKEKSVLLEEEKEIEQPPYTDDERAYLSRLIQRVENAISMREQEYPEFDGQTYSDYYDQNQKLANTFIEPKKNPEDSNFQSGTAREKMFAFLAPINNLNLSPDVSAFDQNNIRIGTFGQAMEDTILKTEELEGDEEKKHLRQFELFSQGTIFVEDVWDERWMKDKRITGGGKFTGQITGLTWSEKLKRVFSRPIRNVLSGLSVFLGNIRQYDFTMQPYFFTLDVKDFLEIEQTFSSWERWKYVPKTFQPPKFEKDGMTYDSILKMLNVENGQGVVIRYQDKWNNEFAVMINNVLMTPIGLPLTAVNGFADYNVIQQNLEPIHLKFAYGNSLMRKLRTKIGLYDEFLRLGVLTTQQKYKPPTLNLSGRVLSSKIWTAGTMTHGVDLKGKIVPIMEGMTFGLSTSELMMIKELKEQINADTVSPTFQGQRTGGDPTATEVVELQRQAKLMLGLSIFACSLLEWKLSWLRLYNNLAKWFDPYDTRIEEVKGDLVKKDVFRRVVVERPIEGEGMGARMVIPTTEQMPTPTQVMEAEGEMKRMTGRPVRITFISPEAIKSSKLIWQITVRPREKTTSELAKLMFRAELGDAVNYFGPRVNFDFYEEIFANTWNRDPNKIFTKSPPMPVAAPAPTQTPKIQGMPTPESATGMNKQVPRQ